MNKPAFATFLLLACLVACASSVKLPAQVTSWDVVLLNRFLYAKQPLGSRDGDLALIVENVNQLKVGAKRAAEAVLALRDLNNCNEDVLAFFLQVKHSGLDKLGDRVGEISSRLATKAGEICAKYIERTVANKYAQLAPDENLAKLLKVLSAAHKTVGYSGITKPFEVIGDAYFVNKFVHEKDTHRKASITGNRVNFDQLFNEKIVQPCQRLMSALGDSYKQAWLVASVQFDWPTFIADRSKPFKSIMWACRSCESLLSMDDEQKTRIFEEL